MLGSDITMNRRSVPLAYVISAGNQAMLGLHPPAETLTLTDNARIELDWVAHDLRKFARLMTVAKTSTATTWLK